MRRIQQTEADREGCSYCADNLIAYIDGALAEIRFLSQNLNTAKESIVTAGEKIRECCGGGKQDGRMSRHVCVNEDCPYHDPEAVGDFETRIKTWEDEIKRQQKEALKKQKKAEKSRKKQKKAEKSSF